MFRRISQALLALITAVALPMVYAAGAPATLAVQEVKELPYGVALYDFFQEKYFGSATQLLVSLEKKRVKIHRDEAELLLGGIYVSYGLFNEAERIFDRLIGTATTQDVANRAWFHLAEIFYHKGHNDQAMRALGRITASLPGELDTRRSLLLGNLYMLNKDYAAAIKLLESVRDPGVWGLYATYNLGIAHAKLGHYDDAKHSLSTVSKTSQSDREEAALRDKANLALGFAALQKQNYSEARTAFRRLRLQGPVSNAGLFGIGQAYYSTQQYEDALNYWSELAQRSIRGPAVFEALLALPQTYALLKAYPAAVKHYERAITVYQSELAQLEQTVTEISQTSLFERQRTREVTDELAWMWDPNVLPDTMRQHFITELFASHEFTEALKNYRDLRFYANHLQQWLDNMAAFDTMLATRRKAFDDRLPQVLKQYSGINLDQLRQRYETLTSETERAATHYDAAAFATKSEQAAVDRLTQINGALSRMEGQADAAAVAELRNKHRLLRGIVTWNLAQEFRPRLHHARQDIKSLRTHVDKAATLYDRLREASAVEPARFDQFRGRIETLRTRTQNLLEAVNSAAVDQEKAIQALALIRLNQQRDRLQRYTTQAQFALAQIYDLLAQPTSGVTPSKP